MKLHYLFLKKFNNYFNRKVIVYTRLSDYTAAADDYYIPVDKTGLQYALFDFNPNDNVTAEAVANNCPFDPDYLVIFDSSDNIVYRWFVKDVVRTREGQWRYTLRRDVVAEKYDKLRVETVFVEKGWVSDPTSPLLLSNEDANVNQVKSQNEILLKDNTEVPWIVLYLVKGQFNDATQINIPSGTADITINTPIADWAYAKYQMYGDPETTEDYRLITRQTYAFNYHTTAFGRRSYMITYTVYGDYVESAIQQGCTNFYTNLNLSYLTTDYDLVKGRLDNDVELSKATLINAAPTILNAKNVNELMNYDGKVIKDSTNHFYSIKVVSVGSETAQADIGADQPLLFATLTNIWNSATSQSASPNNSCFTVSATVEKFRIEINEIPGSTVSFALRSFAGFESDNPLFDVLAMPYGEIDYTNPSEYLHGYTTSAQRSMEIASAIATQLTSSIVLDIQILPYCPIKIPLAPTGGGGYTTGAYMLSDGERPTMFIGDYHELGCELVGETGAGDIIFGVRDTSFTFDIQRSIGIGELKNTDGIGTDELMVKYVNDCTMMRLCSPNYNGVFEFNLAKNGMSIESFNVDMTLRPFNPYIHVNPNFKFVYGADTDDQRGLICGGDFSVGILNNAWHQYEIQNKNYQAIFDRQIKNMDVNNSIAKQEAIIGAITGTFTGGVSGAIGGSFAGIGPIAGAAAGAGMSAIGGIMDVVNLDRRQREARSYAIDNYNLNLGNVKALPNSITKTNALTLNNKLFPFVEIYECTSAEAEAYINKLRWNGMTLGVIGQMRENESEDNSHYFRGKLIRFSDIGEDSHFLEAIDEELRKGVYI